MATVREFVRQAYRLINPSNPTQPLHGDDQELMISVLNQLLQSYASTGLLLTIAKTVSVNVTLGVKYVVCATANYVPAADEVVIANGRLANINEAWLILTGVAYPLIPKSRDDYLASFRYEPLQGLPRFAIVYPDTDVVRIQLYPAPSQFFTYFMRAKFQLNELTSNDTMDVLPQYYQRYLLFATAKDTAMYKGRADAWTPSLEQMLQDATNVMIAASETDVAIIGDQASLLNGAWRVRAGI